MSQRYEYRVRWRRRGMRRGPSKIMQTEAGARAKAERLERLDEELDPDNTGSTEGAQYDDFDGPHDHPLAGMPKLAAAPTLERREVGEWEPLP